LDSTAVCADHQRTSLDDEILVRVIKFTISLAVMTSLDSLLSKQCKYIKNEIFSYLVGDTKSWKKKFEGPVFELEAHIWHIQTMKAAFDPEMTRMGRLQHSVKDHTGQKYWSLKWTLRTQEAIELNEEVRKMLVRRDKSDL
jgi:hypothetical protein